ncbi:MAG: Uma2 family endonuclease [Planctomycetaceae bacterium]|nr:Uma2 family endonuclease [Planctomycetaceae bacterium]
MPQTIELPSTQPIATEDREERSRYCIRIPATACTLDGFRDWADSDDYPQTGAISFLAGEVHIDMSPEDLTTHNQVKRGLYLGWGEFLKAYDVGDFLVDGMLLISKEANLGTEPDGLLCLWSSLGSGKVRFQEKVEGSGRLVEVVGSPDLAAEVVSRSSVHKDTVDLRELYYRAGVDEYWLIDARRAEISFQILARGESEFVSVPADPDGFVFSRVLQASFRMVRVPNRASGWRYTLEFRPQVGG